MFRATLRPSVDPFWLATSRLSVGDASRGPATPHRYACIERQGAPYYCIDVHLRGDEYAGFEAIEFWNGKLVVGIGEHIHLVALDGEDIVSIDLGAYFGSFLMLADLLLVASAERVFRMAIDGGVVWRSGRLGVDGIVIDAVESYAVHGHGEWDPPDGWRPFKISLSDGMPLGGEEPD